MTEGENVSVFASNDIGEPLYATPVLSNGRIFVRGNTSLFAFGEPINAFLEAFNKGDVAGAAATHAATPDLVIIDEVPPYVWRGAQAFTAWATDLDKDAKAHGATGQKVTLGAVTRVETDGTMAYVVVPAVFTFTEKGVALRAAAQMTFVLKKGATGWLIHGWAWTGPKASKAESSANP